MDGHHFEYSLSKIWPHVLPGYEDASEVADADTTAAPAHHASTTNCRSHLPNETLPDIFLEMVAAELDLQQRLGSFANVGKAWRDAACSVTGTISLKTWRQQSHAAFRDYLTRHGKHVLSVELESSGGSVIHSLPCPRLESLSISCSRVQLAADDASPTPTPAASPAHSPLQDCISRTNLPPVRKFSAQAKPGAPGILPHASTALTSLCLHNCTVLTALGLEDAASSLPALPKLQHLSIRDLHGATRSNVTYSVLGRLLQQGGKQLTSLDVRCGSQCDCDSGVATAAAAMMEVGRLPKLRQLSLGGKAAPAWAAANWQQPLLSAQQQITCLKLLQAPIDFSAVSSVVNLQQRRIGSGFLVSILAFVKELHIEGPTLQGVASAGAVLDALVLLPKLRHLVLKDCFNDKVTLLSVRWRANTYTASTSCYMPSLSLSHAPVLLHLSDPQAPPSERLSVLGTLSNLTTLDFSGCTLPPDALHHVFKRPASLSRLRKLRLVRCSTVPGASAQLMSAATAAAVVAGCPLLEHLEADLMMELGQHMNVLQHLRHLKHLSISGMRSFPAAQSCVGALSQLSSLTCLHITNPSFFKFAACAELMSDAAGLTNLQELFVAGTGTPLIKGGPANVS